MKKGLSSVVTTLIIILLVLVAIGIVWIVIKNVIIEGSQQATLGRFLVDLEIKEAYEQNGNIIVKVKRNPGEGDLVKIKFILSDGKNSEIITKDSNMEELAEKSFTLNTVNLDESKIITVSVVPVISSGNKEIIGEIKDTYNLGGAGGGGGDGEDGGNGGGTGDCGNGVIDGGETCDGVEFGGLTCVSFGFIGGNIGCNLCQINISRCIGGVGGCGNGIIDTGEQCDGINLGTLDCTNFAYSTGTLSCINCLIDTSECSGGGGGGQCGNGIINPGEGCDEDNYGGLTCNDFGFGGGFLNCSSCQISTFGCLYVCVPECGTRECGPDPLCGQSCGPCDSPNTCNNGVCVPPACEQETIVTTCGTWICGEKFNNCGVEVTCPPGCTLTQFCQEGICYDIVPVNVGTVQETWPGNSGMYFGSSDLPTNVSYKNYYIEFPGSAEPDCLLISKYVFPVIGYPKSHIAFNFETSIKTGDSYKIWETLEKCLST